MHESTIEIGLASSDSDLEQILLLQQQNLTFTDDGFVTVVHTLDKLRAFHAVMPSVVARQNGAVIGYALSMPRAAASLIPVLAPMFLRLEQLPALNGQRWYVMGQVCIAAQWRGRSVFDGMYAEHRRCFAPQYDWLITEIAMRNPRSLHAHARVGFVEIDHFTDDSDEWSVVGLQLAGTA